MKILLVLVSLIVVVYTNESNSWNSFKIRHHKVYTNQGELKLRQKIFKDNLQTIEEHNKKYEQGLISYKLGINKFADLSDEEFAALFRTLEADKETLQDGHEKFDLTNDGNQELPNEIDWRTKSVVSAVKNQEQCGACWAFSATGTLESQLAIQTGELISLSEQQLVDCDTSNLGCNGGTVQRAYTYVRNNGLTLEKNYPYKAVQGTCDSSRTKEAAIWTTTYVNILRNNETNLKQAVGLVGPVSVAINALPIKLYQEGIFDSECSDVLNHGVLAVGYATDEKTGMEYWILKNSWGTDWGEQGYFKLRKGTNLCGVAKQACYPILGKADSSNNPQRPGGSNGFSIKGGIVSFLVLGIYLFLC